MFGKVNVESFGCLSVEPVRCPVRANHMNVVLHCVNLGNVEVALNLLLNKLVLVCMKAVPGIFKPLEGVIGVSLKVSIMYEIKDSTSCLDDF